MNRIVDDLSVLTNVAKYNLESMVNLSTNLISHAVFESVREQEPYTEVDIGVGTLYIKIEDDMIQYKFIPSTKLDNAVKDTVKNNRSRLTVTVEDTLGKRIMSTYKDLF